MNGNSKENLNKNFEINLKKTNDLDEEKKDLKFRLVNFQSKTYYIINLIKNIRKIKIALTNSCFPPNTSDLLLHNLGKKLC